MRQRERTIEEGNSFNFTIRTPSLDLIRNFVTGIIFFFFSQNIFPQFTAPVFENISIEDGLPVNSVTCILQDHLGYLWLGTENGLVRYDGYTMKVFQPDVNDSTSISGRRITAIFEDRNRILWVGTLNGLNKFNRKTDSFKSYKSNNNNLSINSNEVYSLYEDSKGKFWVGTAEGLNLFNRTDERFTRYYFRSGNEIVSDTAFSYLDNLCVNALIEDPISGNLLIGTAADGLWIFNPLQKTFLKHRIGGDENADKKIGWIQSFCKSQNGNIWMVSYHTLCSLDMYKKQFHCYIDFPIKNEQRYVKRDIPCGAVIEDGNGSIWCGFYHGEKGVFRFSNKTHEIIQYRISPEKLKNSYSNAVFSLYRDNFNIIWIGTWLSGLYKFDESKSKFQLLHSYSKNSPGCLSSSDVYSVIYDSKGFIWFCTRNAIDRYNIKTHKYNHYLNNEGCITLSPYCGIQDTTGDIWLGTSTCGLIRFNTSNNSRHYYFNDPSDPMNLVDKKITRLFQDHLGFLWIGTEGFGIYKYDISQNVLKQYVHDSNDPNSLSQNQIRWIFEDRNNTIWIATNLGGLNKFDRATEKFSNCGFYSCSNIYEDKLGNFWVSDYLTGLYLFDREKGSIIENYSQKDGLTSNAIFGILEDNHNNLWLGTEKGLSRFNTITKVFKHYHKGDGLPDDWFDVASTYGKGPEGEMYFNTRSGIIVFHPDSIKNDAIPPDVVLSNISIINREGETTNYNGFFPEIKEIVLSYDQNDLRFDYVGLEFSEPEAINYKYILEGFNNTWINAGHRRQTIYTNLDQGEYTFKVMAANRDGIWNSIPASLKIIITPPWWKTNLAYFLFALIIVSLVYLIWRLQLRRIRIRQEFDMSKFEAEKMHEVDTIKTRFFTNISHEFRTPLTLIMGPSRQIMEMTDNDRIIENAKLINRSAKKLNRLAGQLLDISRIEAGHMKLKVSPQNIVPVICDIVYSFQSFAERKKIVLQFQAEADEIMLYTDRDKVDKIISNLLSNAIKFTPENGSVRVEVKRYFPENEFVEISVSDTGIGIPKEQLDKIFDRFYQVDNRISKQFEGTGVGLSLTRELAELHKGKIIVDSEEGKGSVFRLLLPFGKKHFSSDELSIDKAEETQTLKTEFPLSPVLINPLMNNKNNGGELLRTNNKALVLIIEDNSELRYYIKGILSGKYNVIEAENGEEGLKKSAEQMPDLIISDIMMPGMDGIQLCTKLKSDTETSHIPLIFLTAKATLKDKIEGLETGADDYIMKPFEAGELIARIKNLLNQKARLHEYFRKHGLFEIDEKQFNPVDRQFLQRAMEITNEHLSDSGFSIEDFASCLSISKSLLHKKFTVLVGEPPGEFIRTIRLNKAAELIKHNSGNITKIAFEVGFNNSSYFTECFKKQFGVSPSQFHNQVH